MAARLPPLRKLIIRHSGENGSVPTSKILLQISFSNWLLVIVHSYTPTRELQLHLRWQLDMDFRAPIGSLQTPLHNLPLDIFVSFEGRND